MDSMNSRNAFSLLALMASALRRLMVVLVASKIATRRLVTGVLTSLSHMYIASCTAMAISSRTR